MCSNAQGKEIIDGADLKDLSLQPNYQLIKYGFIPEYNWMLPILTRFTARPFHPLIDPSYVLFWLHFIPRSCSPSQTSLSKCFTAQAWRKSCRFPQSKAKQIFLRKPRLHINKQRSNESEWVYGSAHSVLQQNNFFVKWLHFSSEGTSLLVYTITFTTTDFVQAFTWNKNIQPIQMHKKAWLLPVQSRHFWLN